MSDPLSHADMFEREYWAVQKVLDEALGTEPEDGAGGGIAAEVYLLMDQRNEARAEVDRLRVDLATAQRERDVLALHLNLSRHEFAPEIPPRPGLADVECRHCEYPRWHPRHDTAAKILAALSAGGTDPTGGQR